MMMNYSQLSEQFTPLDQTAGLVHFFTLRIPGIAVSEDKKRVVEDLEEAHTQIALRHHIDFGSIVRCEQTHGDMSVVVESLQDSVIPDADALITRCRQLPIGIHVADCCPVFIYEQSTPSIALIHSGKRGTLLNITGKTVTKMKNEFQVPSSSFTAVLGPCIRKEHYEMDIPAEIKRQLYECGVERVYDCQMDTAGDLSRYYSYRMEKGKTGRLFGVMMIL